MNNALEKTKEIAGKLINTGFFHIFSSSIINQSVTFLSGIILIRVLTITEYGAFSYTNNIMSLFLLFSGLGMASGIMQISSENFNMPDRALSVFKYGSNVAVGFNIFLSMIMLCFGVIVPLPVSGANDLLLFMFMGPIVIVVFELIQIYNRYNRLNKNYSYFTTTNTIIILVFSIIGAWIYQAKGLVLLRDLGYILSISLGIIVYKFPLSKIRKVASLTKDNKLDLYKISLISMANNATGQLIFILDIFIIGLIIPDESVIATFKVATIIPNALFFIPGALMLYVYPYFSLNITNKKWIKKNVYLIIKYFGLFNLILTGVLILYAPIIVKLIFGAQYSDAVVPFRILAISYFFSATFRKVAGNLLVTQRKLIFNFWLGVFEGIINIICSIILVNNFGSIGAAYTNLIIVIISSIISVRYLIKVINNQ
ncbi:hypothetical protein ASG89_11825 [Paenibacillus sp. Soil766]|uniref:lipopolysaccharide biosynthesis protein n=1 Tax=Paenibacillus sp. Soil766 TaxID=1736404 RepID=UPI000709C6F3|nr:oligosaccharide flippase family protein [Paenibacillus sp. Soil766]KRE83801.1 hypothetical protein ASG89_11825 [Paenibacillus sp. Soil766]